MVVSGQVDPDEYVVFKPPLANPGLDPVIHTGIGAKRVKAVYADQGLTRMVDTSAEERVGRVLDAAEVCLLARWGVAIERHYGCPMDIEWAKDGRTGEVFIVQARPETVVSRRRAAMLHRFRLTGSGESLVEGIAVGEAIGVGAVCALTTPVELERFPAGAVHWSTPTSTDFGRSVLIAGSCHRWALP
ncbi:phosphoenolpyruvate synthase/pyruvate phosphate dikinase [Streptacidiphilus sp. MAP12-33]|uniref:PEP/pyruvate-binding domain-containing protein n=1 Tax=Streptacidiphilus sp. MAP12-33 TaxID=3156266 RepID=UPI003518EC43